MPERRQTRLLLGCLLLSSMACHRQSAADHARRGAELFQQHRDREALIEFAVAVQADPRLGDARLGLAGAYARVGDLKNALGQYVRAADLLPGSIEAQIKAGQFLLLARAFDEAKARADRAIAIDSSNVDAQVLRGNALAGLKDLDGAITEYEAAIALDPSNDAASSNLGILQLLQHRSEQAETTFRNAVRSSPQSMTARLALANFLWASGRRDEAEQALKDAVATDRTDMAANRALGMFYLSTGRAAQAEPYFLASARGASPTATLTLAQYYTAMKRYDDARRELATLAAHPEAYASATVRRASIDAVEGYRAKAQSVLRDLLAKQPKYAPALLLSARLSWLDGELDQALATARVLTASDSTSPLAAAAYQLIGQVQGARDRDDDAIAAYMQVLKLNPKSFASCLALANLYQRRNQATVAATYARQALDLEPANPEARTVLVRNDIASGRIESAKHELEILAHVFPGSPAVITLTGLAELAEKHGDAARASFVKALRVSPGHVEALNALVQLDIAAGRVGDAIAIVEAQLARQKAEPGAALLMLAGQTYEAAGDVAKAEALLKQASRVDRRRVQADRLLGQLYLNQNRLGDAADTFGKIIERDPRSVAALTSLGMVLDRQGRTAEAEQQYQRALALDSTSIAAANNLAWLYASRNRNLDQALELAQGVYQQLPDDPNVNDTLGWVYYRKRMADRALPYLRTSVSKVPTEPTFQYHLGMASLQAGHWDEARLALRQALALRSDFDGAAQARAALDSIGA